MQTEPNQNGDITCSPPEVALERKAGLSTPLLCDQHMSDVDDSA